MATITETRLVDDLDGSPADETVEFALDGRDYEIELSDANADRLRGSLAEFIDAARKAGSGGHSRKPAKPEPAGKRRTRVDRDEALAIREWVRANGDHIGDRGRIPQKYVDAYRNGDTSIFTKGEDDEQQPETDQTPEPAFVGGGVGDPFSTFTEPQGPHF